MVLGSLVVPGVRLCMADSAHQGGPGTYTQHGYIYSSLAGELTLVTRPDKVTSVEVMSATGKDGCVVPAQRDIVTVKVLAVNPRFAKVHILCVGEVVLSEPFRGMIRKEDVRATEKDRVEMYRSFRPGDISLARVISLGDAMVGYLLTTAENELGVVIARSEAGAAMVPVSWTEMQCPITCSKEGRKVAKVMPEQLAREAVS